MAASLRRLVKDHAKLRNDPPPNYLFPDNDDASSLPDDLTQLIVLVTGAEGTPYSQGLWRLHLKMPEDYPKNPPKATFRTRIYHPNVDESTGAVCLETLKRDWDPKLTLKDILVTVSCLLIQPNPDSALNAAAGALIQEDYDAFSTQARLMTKIHASIPPHLASVVQNAKKRGEDHVDRVQELSTIPVAVTEKDDDPKENRPNHSRHPSRDMRMSSQAKRPLSELPSPVDPSSDPLTDKRGSGSDTNVARNVQILDLERASDSPPRKSPKLMRPGASPHVDPTSIVVVADESRDEGDKENIMIAKGKEVEPGLSLVSRPTALRKVSNVGARRTHPRVGIRRL